MGDAIRSGLTVEQLTSGARGHIQSSGRTPEEVLSGRNIFHKLPLIALAVALVFVAARVLVSASPSAADPALDSEEQQFLSLLNQYRASNGLVTLVLQDDLNEASDWYASDMATKNYFGSLDYCSKLNPPKPAHCDSLGRMPGARAMAFGYPQGVGENSAGGFTTAQAVFDAWKASPGHNSNMLGSTYRAIGIGRACTSYSKYGCYWVTDFGFYTGAGSTNAPGATTPAPSQPATATATPTPTPSPTSSPTPTPPPVLIWDDFDCDGEVTPSDAIQVIRGDIGLDAQGGACPSVWDVVVVDGRQHLWGDTDCSSGVRVLDGIKLLAYIAGVTFDVVGANCPAPGTEF